MSDDLKEHAAELRRLAAQKTQSTVQQGSGDQDLDEIIDLRLNQRNTPPAQTTTGAPAPAPPTTTTAAPSRPATTRKPKATARKPTRPISAPQLAINMDADLHKRSTASAEQANVSYAEYIRQVIENYADQIQPKKPTIRRPGSARGSVRITVRITQDHSDIIDQTTKRTGRAKTSMINMSVHKALADDFVPVIEEDDY